MKKNGKIVVNSSVVFRKEGKEAIIFDSSTGSMEILNETGVFIWQFFNSKNTLEDIVKKAVAKYSGNKDGITKDLQGFLKELVKSKYIEIKK